VQKTEPLGHELSKEKIETGGVAARPGEARHEAELDRVFGDAEDDRDRRGRRFGGARGLIVASGGNYGNATADEVAHERWELSAVGKAACRHADFRRRQFPAIRPRRADRLWSPTRAS